MTSQVWRGQVKTGYDRTGRVSKHQKVHSESQNKFKIKWLLKMCASSINLDFADIKICAGISMYMKVVKIHLVISIHAIEDIPENANISECIIDVNSPLVNIIMSCTLLGILKWESSRKNILKLFQD